MFRIGEGSGGGVLRLVYPPPPPLSQLLDQPSFTAPHLQGGPGSWWLWASLSGTLTPSQSDSEPQRLPAPQYYSSPLHPHFLGQPLTPGCCDSRPPGLPGNARRQPSGMWPGRKAGEVTFGFTWGQRPGWSTCPSLGPRGGWAAPGTEGMPEDPGRCWVTTAPPPHPLEGPSSTPSRKCPSIAGHGCGFCPVGNTG